MECLVHYSDVTKPSIMLLTEQNFKRFAEQWMNLDVTEEDIALKYLEVWSCSASEIMMLSKFGFH